MISKYLKIKKQRNKNTIYAVYQEEKQRKELYISKTKPFCIISENTTKQLKKLFNKSETVYKKKRTVYINIKEIERLTHYYLNDSEIFIIDNVDYIKNNDIEYLLYFIQEVDTIFVLGFQSEKINKRVLKSLEEKNIKIINLKN